MTEIDLERLVEQFTEEQRRGKSPTIEDYARRYPDFAEEIREFFPVIGAMEDLKKVQKETAKKPVIKTIALKRLGDFRIFGEIGRGGMGIVYKAEQESLQRKVAVKILPPSLTSQSQIVKRFYREAQLAAQLHHTNIVPIFGMGKDRDVHYYVMQFIEGCGLDKIITAIAHEKKDLPVEILTLFPEFNNPAYFKKVAQMGKQLAQALSYAHDKTTLHRDIKPANLLIDKNDIVWITDLGLAKAEHSERITRTGEISGTLCYMAPEQIQGRADNRTDIYGLGITLYELLTLQSAFADKRQSDIVNRITKGIFSKPRAVNKKVPRDLESIILKATATNPDDRYGNGEEMAEDFRLFLQNRPVHARPVDFTEKIWLWCRRNPMNTILCLLTLLITALLVIGYNKLQKTKSIEEQRQQQLEQSEELSRQVLNKIYHHFAYPQKKSEDKKNAVLLEELLEYRNTLSPSKREKAETHIIIAGNFRKSKITEKAMDHYQKATDILIEILTVNSTTIENWEMYGEAIHGQSALLMTTKNYHKITELLENSNEILLPYAKKEGIFRQLLYKNCLYLAQAWLQLGNQEKHQDYRKKAQECQ